MKKKGFTLIELLAVIVVVAIIALIAVPLVLNSIEKARIGAAKVSAATYINEVEKYIVLAKMDPSKVQLEVGQTYQISDINNEEVGLLDYLIEPVNAESNVIILNDLIKIKGDKPESGIVTIGYDYKVESATLIVNKYKFEYGNGNYEYKGKAEEENIIPEDPVVTVYAEPTLTINGITKVNIDVDNHAGTKTYYSIDNGTTWIEYTGVVYEKFETIQVKSISASGNESNIITESYIESSSDSLPIELFDKDESKGLSVSGSTRIYLNIDSSAENIQIKMKSNSTKTWYYFYNSNGEQIGEILKPNGEYVSVPAGAVRVQLLNPEAAGRTWYEVLVDTNPLIEISEAYPTVTLDGINAGICNVKIDYHTQNKAELYSINEGEWIKYSGPITVNAKDNLTVKRISKYGTEFISTAECKVASDSLPEVLYKEDETGSYTISRQSSKFVNIDSSAENIEIKMNSRDSNAYLYFYNLAGEEIDKKGPTGDYVTVPVGAVKLKIFNPSSVATTWYKLEIRNQPVITIDTAYPILTSTGVTDGVCNVDIKYYKEEKSKLYQIDNGEWNSYNGSLKIKSGSTLVAKGISKSGVEHISTVKCEEASDGLPKILYNGKENDSSIISRQSSKFVNIDSSAENVEIKMVTEDSNAYLYFYNSAGEQLDKKGPTGDYVTVPVGAVKLKIFNPSNSATYWYELVVKQS